MGMLRCLLLTESNSNQGFATFRLLAEKMLYLLDAGAAIGSVVFERGDERARAAMGFNAYKSTKKQDYGKQADLADIIATALLRTDLPTFVLVHIDGDRRWSDRANNNPLNNEAVFDRVIVRRVRAILEHRGRLDLLDRILHATPFWCTEAWLYQNSVELAKIAAQNAPRHDADAAILQLWRDSPRELDEVVRPKDATRTFKDKYNVELATTFPGRKVHELGLSFAACVDAMRKCSSLVTQLAALRHDRR